MLENVRGKTLVLGVGAQKAGTTWIHDYLRSSEQVCCSPIKELHFFDAWFAPQLCRSFDHRFYRELIEAARGGSKAVNRWELLNLTDRVRMSYDRDSYVYYFNRLNARDRPFLCEITPSYAVLTGRAFTKVKAFLERFEIKPKVFFIMRDPVARYYSTMRMVEIQSGGDRHIDNYFLEGLKSPQHIARSRFDRTIRALREAFDESDLHFEFYETLFSDSSAATRRLADFIGMDHIAPSADRRLNPSLVTTVEREALTEAALDAFKPVYDYVNAHFKDQKPSSWLA